MLPEKQLGLAMSFIIIASGVPFYYIFVWLTKKLKIFAMIDDAALIFSQKQWNFISFLNLNKLICIFYF
jgi:hypothetical protein